MFKAPSCITGSKYTCKAKLEILSQKITYKRKQLEN